MCDKFFMLARRGRWRPERSYRSPAATGQKPKLKLTNGNITMLLIIRC